MDAININDLKTGFQKFYFDSSLKGMRYGIGLAFVLFLLFGLLDVTPIQWFIRFGIICPVLLITFCFTYSSRFEKLGQPILTSVYFIVSVSLIAMIHVTPDGIQAQVYTIGLTLCIIGASAVRLRKKWALPACFLIVVIFCLVKRNEVALVMLHFPILLSAVAITFLTISSTERILKANYAALVLLDTERKQLKEVKDKLEAADTKKSKLISIITHDLKAPNTNIIALLTMLNAKSISQDEFTLYARRLKSQVINNQKLLETLLKWSVLRMENKEKLANVNVREVVEECIELLQEFASRKGNILINELDDRIIVSDRDILQVVVRNILCNAIKFTDNGTITIFTYNSNDNQFHLSIADTGVGMKPEFVNKLFNWNVRASTNGTKQEVGTGIGLLLCGEFLQAIGGSIQINSIPEKGTNVTVRIKSKVLAAESVLA